MVSKISTAPAHSRKKWASVWMAPALLERM